MIIINMIISLHVNIIKGHYLDISPSVLSSRVPQWQTCLRLELRGGGAGRTSPARAGAAGQRRPHLRAGRGGAEPHPAGGGGQRPRGGGHLCGRSFPQGQVLPHGLHAALHVQPCKCLGCSFTFKVSINPDPYQKSKGSILGWDPSSI